MAVGLAATTAVVAVTNAVLLRPLPYPRPDGLYRLNASLSEPKSSQTFALSPIEVVRLQQQAGSALVGDSSLKQVPDVLMPRLGYSDYNLFDSPDSSVQANYNVGVAGKNLRADSGFALHDVPVGGPVNKQTDPKFAGPIPRGLPFDDAAVISRMVDVCQILAFYRQAYTPGAGSPLIDAGDPADGAGNDIGAIGSGADDPQDQFGKFCDPAAVTPLAPAAKVFKCDNVPIGGGSAGTGGTGGNPVAKGFACVCTSAAAGDTGSHSVGVLLVLALAAGLTLRARHSRNRR